MGSGGAEYPIEKIRRLQLEKIRRLQSQLDETRAANRRLNRRCQKAESELHLLRREMSSAIKIMEFEAKRAHRYANALCDVHRHHEKIDRMPWIKCWWCRLRRWFRFQIWNRMFSMKEKSRHIN